MPSPTLGVHGLLKGELHVLLLPQSEAMNIRSANTRSVFEKGITLHGRSVVSLAVTMPWRL